MLVLIPLKKTVILFLGKLLLIVLLIIFTFPFPVLAQDTVTATCSKFPQDCVDLGLTTAVQDTVKDTLINNVAPTMTNTAINATKTTLNPITGGALSSTRVTGLAGSVLSPSFSVFSFTGGQLKFNYMDQDSINNIVNDIKNTLPSTGIVVGADLSVWGGLVGFL